MALIAGEVEAFLAASKQVPDGRRLSWRKRSEHVRLARVPVEVGAIETGELLLLVNLAHRRHWTFPLLLRSTEIRRWDLLPSGPRRHRNPPGRPDGWPATVRSLEHEHVWYERIGRGLHPAIASPDPERPPGGVRSLCDAVAVDPKDSCVAPPPPGQQLQFS